MTKRPLPHSRLSKTQRRILIPVGAAGIVAIIAMVQAPSGRSDGDGLPRLPFPTRKSAAPADEVWPQLDPVCPAPASTARPSITVEQLNAVVNNLDLTYWQAADIGASGRLSDNRLVWIFGDTIRKPSIAPNMVANSMLITSDLCANQVLTREQGPVIPDRADGVVFWPTSLVVVPGTPADEVVVFASRIRREGTGAFAFSYLGSTAFRFTVPHGGAPTLAGEVAVTPDSADADQINWGGATMVNQPWVYVYGTRRTAAASARSLYVARAPLADPEDRAHWEFWNGKRWQSDYRKVAAVLPATDGVSQTLSADFIDGQYVLVSKRGGDFGDDVYSWSSETPVGPWKRSKGVRAEFRDAAGGFRYAPIAHPEIGLDSGKLLISVSRNSSDFGELLRNPRVGRPYFAEIPWPK